MVFPDNAVRFCTETDNDISQHTVVHILAAFPYDLSGVDPKRIALLDMVVQKRRQKVICRSNRMKIPGKMQV